MTNTFLSFLCQILYFLKRTFSPSLILILLLSYIAIKQHFWNSDKYYKCHSRTNFLEHNQTVCVQINEPQCMTCFVHVSRCCTIFLFNKKYAKPSTKAKSKNISNLQFLFKIKTLIIWNIFYLPYEYGITFFGTSDYFK